MNESLHHNHDLQIFHSLLYIQTITYNKFSERSRINPANQPKNMLRPMEAMKFVEKVVIVPAEKPTTHRSLFLSNIDLTLVSYLETVSFIQNPLLNDNNNTGLLFADICSSFYDALSRILVSYDFLAGRLRLQDSAGDDGRFEIDCNGEGVVVVAATSSCEMSKLFGGDFRVPKPDFKQLVGFLHDEEFERMEITKKPLLLLQLTHFQCGGLALASLSNHCTLDGISTRDFLVNLASFTRGEDLIVNPNSDRTVFKARNPPIITHHHFEYSIISNISHLDTSFSIRGTTSAQITEQPLQNPTTTTTQLVHLSPNQITNLKALALKNGRFSSCTTFHVVAAKIWKARSIATGASDECMSTMLFPVDVRKRIQPNTPYGFAGNGIIPGFARSDVGRLKMEEFSFLVENVKKGVERMDDEYIRSGIDWLEVNEGVPTRVNSFSVVDWSRLGLEGVEFKWGKIKSVVPMEVKEGLVILLPGDTSEGGGINICLELPSVQMEKFNTLMMED